MIEPESKWSLNIEGDGPSALVAVIYPIALTMLPAVSRRADVRTLLCAALGTLLGVLSLSAGLYVGLLYAPAAGLMVAAGGLGVVFSRSA